jgi:hypothetical protein
MPTQMKIQDVEAALIELCQNILAEEKIEVQGVSSRVVDAEGNLIVNPPIVLVYFEGESPSSRSDNLRRTYQVQQLFSLLCGTADFSSRDSEREGAYELLSTLREGLAGARLTLADGHKTMPITLSGVAPEQVDEKGVWYSLKLVIEAVAQFPGAHA